MARDKLDFMTLGTEAVTVSIVAGVFSWLLTMLVGNFVNSGPVGSMIFTLVVLAATIMLAPKVKFDDTSLFRFVIFVALLGVVGTLVNLALPMASGFILSAGSITPSGLLLTFFYVMVAEWILAKVGL